MRSASTVPHDFGPRYRWRRELGRGGAGTVYLVYDEHLRCDVALKFLHAAPSSVEELAAYQQEFSVLAESRDPGIAAAYDFGYLDGVPYFTSEYVPGEPLSSSLPIEDPTRVVALTTTLLRAVGALHTRGVLHLDIKPSNIMLPREAGPACVLIDFGLCRRVGTLVPGQRGSRPFMAPEYVSGETLGAWTDVYALGVTLYRLATGRFPRPGATTEQGAVHTSGPDWDPAPVAPSSIAPRLPRDLDHVILRCLALDTGARSFALEDVASALDGTSPQGARRAGSRPRATSAARRTSGGPEASGQGRQAPGRGTFMVGRAEELARVDRFFESPGGERYDDSVLLVTSTVGAGQSHFLREIKRRAQLSGQPAYLEEGFSPASAVPGGLLRALTAHVRSGPARKRLQRFLSRLRARRSTDRGSLRDDTTDRERRLRRAGELALALRSLSEPIVLVVDALERFDEISISLIVDLARVLSVHQDEQPPQSLCLVIGYREEGPSKSLLEELTKIVLVDDLSPLISLGTLSASESWELYRAFALGRDALSAIALYRATGGTPARVVDFAIGEAQCDPSEANDQHSDPATSSEPCSDLQRELLSLLICFDRPVLRQELSSLVDASLRSVRSALDSLASRDLLESFEGGWRVLPAGVRRAPTLSVTRRRELHRKVAELLWSGAVADARTVEAFHHFVHAGRRRAIVEVGRVAASYLMSTLQNRAALDVLRQVYDRLGRVPRATRVEIALEIADLHACVGDLGDGVDLLRELLAVPSRRGAAVVPSPGGLDRRRLQLGLAVLRSRQGDFKRAAVLFEEALEGAASKRTPLRQEEALHYLGEYAAMRAFTGAYDKALALCDRGLKIAGRSRARRIREVTLNLYATQAGVALRTYDFEMAIERFERGLQVAEATGSVTNRAVLLNNLGIVYNQCDRSADAIRAFREAERTCLQLDEGPSLVSIYCNLAALHARRGEFDLALGAIDQARELSPAGIGRRQQFFLEHGMGLCALYRGRFSEARERFECAITLGESMGDRHVAAFDRLFAAEALVWAGEYVEAERRLEQLSGDQESARIRAMALARSAWLSGLLGDRDSAGRAIDRHQRIELLAVPYLDAWDAVYVGWAHALCQRTDVALESFDRARRSFDRGDFRPAFSFASWLEAETRFCAGDSMSALRAARSAGRQGNDLTDVLWPLLDARLALERTGTLGCEPHWSDTERRRIASDLVRAGSGLVGNPLPEWSLRIQDLRTAFRPEAKAREEVDRAREQLAERLSPERRELYLASSHWDRWSAFRSVVLDRDVSEERDSVVRDVAELDDSGTTTRTRETAPRARFVSRSGAMSRVTERLDRMAPSEAPVLVWGETGVGKEFVARVIHAESPRRDRPLEVVSCPSIPVELIEAELLGARAGAFTGIERDRVGILPAASGGTVVLDEIGELSLGVQAKLLRLLSSNRVRALGAEDEQEIDVRFIFTTAQDLSVEVEAGRFRRDLLHRVRVLEVEVPPLRERAADVEELVRVFWEEAVMDTAPGERDAEVGSARVDLTPELVEELVRRPWPGNVRELRNLVLRLSVETPGGITLAALRGSERESSRVFPGNLLAGRSFDDLKERLEREYVQYHLRRLCGDADALCAFLQLGRRQLYRRLERLGLSLRSERRRQKSERDG